MWKATKDKANAAGAASKKAAQKAKIKGQIMDEQSNITSVKHRFGVEVYSLWDDGKMEECGQLFEETREKVLASNEIIAQRELELAALKD